MQIQILAVGKKPQAWLAAAEADFLTRLAPSTELKIVLVPPEDENILGAEKAKQKENAKLLAKIPAGFRVVACDRGGVELTSERFAEHLRNWRDASEKVCCVIGGSHGLSSEILQKADLKISFSKLTFPHELFRVLLLEQIYRGFSILAGKKYHK